MLEESKYFIILAGPNGAGKSTLATDLIYKRYKVQTFDWDKEFELEWKRFQFDPKVEQGVRDKVSDDFQNLIETSFSKDQPVAYETNYHSEYNIKLLKKAEALGYQTRLIFLLLDSHKIATNRVKKRALKGGHFVNDYTIKNRFFKGLSYLDRSFDLFDKTYIINTSSDFRSEPIMVVNKSKSKVEVKSYKPIPPAVVEHLPRLSALIGQKS